MFFRHTLPQFLVSARSARGALATDAGSLHQTVSGSCRSASGNLAAQREIGGTEPSDTTAPCPGESQNTVVADASCITRDLGKNYSEQAIRRRERETVAWLRAAPWRGGRDLADTVAWCRRQHTASIARQRADEAARRMGR